MSSPWGPYSTPGTAPRRVGGVWYTATGRKLTAAGQKFWTQQWQLGVTDGNGHYNHHLGQVAHQARLGATPAARQRAGKQLGAAAKQQQHAFFQPHGTFQHVLANTLGVLSPVPTNDEGPLGTGLAFAGILPFGKGARAAGKLAKGLRGADEAAQVAHGADAALQAQRARSAIRRGLDQPTDWATGEPVATHIPGPESYIQDALPAMKEAAAARKELIRSEKAQRLDRATRAYNAAGGGTAGHEAWKREMGGAYSQIRFDDLTGLTDEQLNHYTRLAYDHPELDRFGGPKVAQALKNMQKGIPPREHEIKLLAKVFGPEAGVQAAQMKPYQSWLKHAAGQIVNLPRAIQTTADLSVTFRQLLMAFAHKPSLVLKTLGPQVKALWSHRYVEKAMRDLENDPWFNEARDYGSHMTDLSGRVSGREEMFPAQWAEVLTGGTKHGVVVRFSRAFTLAMNIARRDMYKDLVEGAIKAKVPASRMEKLRKDAARAADWATGRGELPGPLEKAAPALNIPFFAPRLAFSRIQAFNPLWYASLDPYVRKRMVLAMAKLSGGVAGAGAGAYALGGRASVDPTNADFGKVRVGNVRFDVSGGFAQYPRLEEQMRQRKITSSQTGIAKHAAVIKPLKKYARNKLSPPASFFWDAASGKDSLDRPFKWQEGLKQRSYPLVGGDVLDVYRQTGSPEEAALAYFLGALGIGVQAYTSNPKPKKSSTIQGKIEKAFKQKSVEEQLDAAFRNALK